MKAPAIFKTRQEIERYFGEKTIQCLLCGARFRRLGTHLAAKHGVSVDEYRRRFGLPWSRGLTSEASRLASGWTEARKAKARRLARASRFFEYPRPTPRREGAAYLKAQALQNLGIDPRTLSADFERKVRLLFDKGLSDRVVAKILDVGASTVNRRTKHCRKRSGKRKARR